MAPKKKKSNVYFTKITDFAIAAYNQTAEQPALREKIYRRFIYPAFMKMAENLINKIKPTYIDSSFIDLQTDLVTYLTERLNKFNPAAGKAYSYYTRTSFNYLIAENQKAYSKLKADALEIDVDEQRNIIIENIENFNKKALYIFIRERTGLETTNITRVIKTLKQIYVDNFKAYEQSNFVKLPF